MVGALFGRGRRVGGAGVSLPVRNPRTGEADHTIEPLTANDLRAVAERLRAAQPAWAALGADGRADVLRRWAGAIAGDQAPLTDALFADTGRRGISKLEVSGTVQLIERWAARAPDLIHESEGGERPTAFPGVVARTRLHPYGLVGAISPWNFPLTLGLIDAVPALAAGCAVLIKPSEVTPRFIRPLMALMGRVPELASVLAVVEGDGATGAALIPLVDYVCFTGSVATGKKVAEAAARAFVPASLELGGKDPLLVLESADPGRAATVALRASVVNSGQACQSIERVYVARPIAQAFLAALVRAAEAVRLSYPDPDKGDVGPFIFRAQADIVRAQLADAVAKGARVLAGGTVEELGGGSWLRPTVLADVTPDMAVMRDETFGPVIPVATFGGVDEAVALANGGDWGLSAAVLAGDLAEAEAVAVRLRAGAVSIGDGALTSMVYEAEKTSWGRSGLGPSRMGNSGLLRFLRRQALLVQTGDPLPLSAYSEEALA